MNPSKENPAVQGGASKSTVCVLYANNPQEEKQSHLFCKAGLSLRKLKENPKGLTRSEAWGRYGILSLTQHVFVLRHEYGIEIHTEWVTSHDGAKYGRYHLITPVLFPSERSGVGHDF